MPPWKRGGVWGGLPKLPGWGGGGGILLFKYPGGGFPLMRWTLGGPGGVGWRVLWDGGCCCSGGLGWRVLCEGGCCSGARSGARCGIPLAACLWVAMRWSIELFSDGPCGRSCAGGFRWGKPRGRSCAGGCSCGKPLGMLLDLAASCAASS